MPSPKQPDTLDQMKIEARHFQEALRKALATPPISNEEIERRSKERRKRA